MICGGMASQLNISRELVKGLPEGLVHLLHEIGVAARGRSENAYLVGGLVRDVLLGQPNYDLDVVVEGEAIALAQEIAKGKDRAIKTHSRFGTAKVNWDDFALDIVTARSETYAHPGALPTVAPGTIDDDLARRDFSINAMAVDLIEERFGDLLDPHGGLDDLRKRQVRALYSASFTDDPTRMLRAIRYEQRLGFRLEEKTEALLVKSLDALDTVSGERLWHELELILGEEKPEKVLLRAEVLGLLKRLYPFFKADRWLVGRLAAARERFAGETLALSQVYLGLLAYRLTDEQSEGCIERFRMPRWAARTLRGTARLRSLTRRLADRALSPSKLYRRLENHSAEVVAVLAVASSQPLLQNRLTEYVRTLRHVKPVLRGDDLKEMGVPPGQEMGRILRALQDARLDKQVTSREEEEELVYRLSGSRTTTGT